MIVSELASSRVGEFAGRTVGELAGVPTSCEQASRARVVCSGHTQTGINNTCLSDHAHVRAKARRRQFTEAEVAAWRERIFADGLEDPVKVAVEEAVRDFGRPEDFTLWAWYANRIGVNSFLDLYFEQKSIMRGCRLRSPAAAFHARLKRFHAAYFGAKEGPLPLTLQRGKGGVA